MCLRNTKFTQLLEGSLLPAAPCAGRQHALLAVCKQLQRIERANRCLRHCYDCLWWRVPIVRTLLGNGHNSEVIPSTLLQASAQPAPKTDTHYSVFMSDFTWCHDSSVDIVSLLRPEQWRNSRLGQELFPFFTTSTPSVWPTRPVFLDAWDCSPGDKAAPV
jgi:hypothetical protein